MSQSDSTEETIFEAARHLGDAEKQAAYLDLACGKDEALRQRIEQLLCAGQRAKDFFQKQGATLRVPQTIPTAPITERPGSIIARYKLLQQIGEGGCGVVYMAEQKEPVRRRVALKVIKLGMDTKEVIARFEAERQALAMMDHPNIAKVLDAGATDTGRPYFVMELVRGIKITEFCDENKVPTEERLKLFIQVCQAIQHAHQKGIIHRDIKPSNILVTINDGVPVPKVIDFGIAKATQGRLTDSTLFTAFEQFIGTPAYMSPEQAMMTSLDIDTRSDIYSLGVLLYELLTGKTPFDQQELLAAGLDEMRRTIRDKEPQRPSTRLDTMAADALTTTATMRQTNAPKLVHVVRGDLDWIAMKCLEKDRGRRYETANGLATDIARHLNNEPVVARPPSRLYRFQKSVSRNRLAYGAAAAVVLALVVGLAVSTAMFYKARTEAAKSREVARFLKDMLKSVEPSVALGRDTTMVREVVDRTADRISIELKGQPEVEIELRLTLAQVYFELQEYKKMEQTARETLRLARAHFGEENLAVADSLNQLGSALFFLRVRSEAETTSRAALELQRKLRGNGSLQEARALFTLSDIWRHQGKFSAAEAATRRAVAIRRTQLGNDNDEVAWSLYQLRLVLSDSGKLAEAEATIREGLAIRQKIHGDFHPYTGADYIYLGEALAMEGKLDEAITNFEKGLEIMHKTGARGKWHEAWGQMNFAGALEGQGKLDEAETHCRAGYAIARKEMGPDHPDLSAFARRVASILRREGKLAEARPFAEEAVALCQRNPDQLEFEPGRFGDAIVSLRSVLTDLGQTNEVERLDLRILQFCREHRPSCDQELATALVRRSEWLVHQGKSVEAEEIIDSEALPIIRQLIDKDNKRSDDFIQLGHLQWQLGSLLGDCGRNSEAEEPFVEALRIFTKANADFPDQPFLRQEQGFSHRLLGDLLIQLGRFDEVEQHYRAAIALYTGLKKETPSAFYHQEEAYTTWMLGAAMDRAGRVARAAAEYRKAIVLHEEALSKFPADPNFKSRLGSVKADLASLLARQPAAGAKPTQEQSKAIPHE